MLSNDPPSTRDRYTSGVPTLSRFYGIVVVMFYREHDPPHFHARYAGRHMAVGISPARLLNGSLPRRAEGMVLEWARQHQAELLANWERAQRRVPLESIAPLE